MVNCPPAVKLGTFPPHELLSATLPHSHTMEKKPRPIQHVVDATLDEPESSLLSLVQDVHASGQGGRCSDGLLNFLSGFDFPIDTFIL